MGDQEVVRPPLLTFARSPFCRSRHLVAALCLICALGGCATDVSDTAETTPLTPSRETVVPSPPPTSPTPRPELEIRDGNGRTPLVAATKSGDVDTARRLILAGADVNAKDNLADSAFLYAGAEGLDDILVLTLDHGADVRSLNRYGGTALIPAAENGHPSTVQLLIDAGVPLDHVNDSGWTALLEAVVYGDGSARYQDVVARLLAAGADPDIRDAQGRTALENARSRGHVDIVRLLGG